MTRIVCDTMIWYELSKNNLLIPNPAEYKLVCTYLSLMELAFTPNNFRNLEEVQKVIQKILDCQPEIIVNSPLVHAETLINSDFKEEFNIEQDLIFGFLKVLLNQPKQGVSDGSFLEQLTAIISIRKANNKEWADFINTLHTPTKLLKRRYKSI